MWGITKRSIDFSLYDEVYTVSYEPIPDDIPKLAKSVILEHPIPTHVKFSGNRDEYESNRFIAEGKRLTNSTAVFRKFSEVYEDIEVVAYNYVKEHGKIVPFTECVSRQFILSLFENVYDSGSIENLDMLNIKASDNIVLIPGIINISHSCDSIFTADERYEQTKRQLKSIRKNIPNSKSILLEQGGLNLHQISELHSLADVIILFSDDKQSTTLTQSGKSLGEVYVLRYILNHLKNYTFNTFFKFGGRYRVLDSFDMNTESATKIVTRTTPENLSYSNRPFAETIIYSVPRNLLDKFNENLSQASNFIDVEHALYGLFHDDIYHSDNLHVIGTSAAGIFNKV
jgi:hypothetical protein